MSTLEPGYIAQVRQRAAVGYQQTAKALGPTQIQGPGLRKLFADLFALADHAQTRDAEVNKLKFQLSRMHGALMKLKAMVGAQAAQAKGGEARETVFEPGEGQGRVTDMDSDAAAEFASEFAGIGKVVTNVVRDEKGNIIKQDLTGLDEKTAQEYAGDWDNDLELPESA